MTDKTKKSSIEKSANKKNLQTKSFTTKGSSARKKNIKSSSDIIKLRKSTGSENKKDPRVALDRKSVFVVSGAIVLACALVLFVSSLVQTGNLIRRMTSVEVTEDLYAGNDVWQELASAVPDEDDGPKPIKVPDGNGQNESGKKSDVSIKESSEIAEEESCEDVPEGKYSRERENKFVPEGKKNPSAENDRKKEQDPVKKSMENVENKSETRLKEFQENVAENGSAFGVETVSAKNGDNLVTERKYQESLNSLSTPVDSGSRKNASSSDKKSDAPVGKYKIPVAKNSPYLVFVIDDGGLHPENVTKYAVLPFPITIAVLPKLSGSRECADVVRHYGKELILHQPMQAKNLSINPGAGSLQPDMTTSQIAALIKSNLDDLGPGVRGMNNHEGSLITEDLIKMEGIYFVCQEHRIYFLDSRTSAQSAARQASLEVGNRIYERNAPFLDNAVTKDDMLREIYKGLDVANKNGFAIIIGHVDKSADILPDLLLDMYPELIRKGYRFATPSTLP